jgi:hypothetical protein
MMFRDRPRIGIREGAMEAHVISKVSRRIVPFVALCYFLCYLDQLDVVFCRHLRALSNLTVRPSLPGLTRQPMPHLWRQGRCVDAPGLVDGIKKSPSS